MTDEHDYRDMMVMWVNFMGHWRFLIKESKRSGVYDPTDRAGFDRARANCRARRLLSCKLP